MPLAQHDQSEAINTLDKVEGVLIEYPLHFLEQEWFPPSSMGMAKENLAPVITFI